MKPYFSSLLALAVIGVARQAGAQSAAAVTTGPAQNVSYSSAQLNGTFLPPAAGLSQEVALFDYGLTTNYGSSTVGQTPIGQSFSADYNDDQGFVTSALVQSFNYPFTIEAWIVNGGSSQDETILVTSANAPGNNSKVRLSLNYSVPRFEVWDSSGNYYDIVSATSPVPGGQWVHLAVVLAIDQNGNLPTTIYVNGQPVASKTFSYESRSVGNRQIFIGRSTWLHNQSNGDGGYPFSGYIGEVRVWDINLDQTTIQNWMNQPVPLQYVGGPPAESTWPVYHPYNLYLVDYYRFNGAGNGIDDGWQDAYAYPYGNPGGLNFGPPLVFTTPAQTITGLQPGTTYHYRGRLVPYGSSTTIAAGGDMTFTTQGPQLGPISNQMVSKDSGNHSMTLTGITDTNPGHPAFNFNVTSSNPSIVPTPIIYNVGPPTTAQLTFAPGSNVTGSSTITVTASYPYSGGTAAATQSFLVTVTNVPPVVGPGAAVSLNGVNQYINVPGGIWFSNQFTVEGWVYARSNSTGAKLFDFGNGPGLDNVFGALVGPSGGPRLSVFPTNASNGSIDSTTPVPVNQWSHLAFARDTSGTGHIYLNGVQIASGPLNTPTGAIRTNNYIGQGNWSSDPWLNAKISDFRIWNVALNPQQLTNVWSSALPGTTAGILLDYRFNEGSGMTAFDATAGVSNPAVHGPKDGSLSYNTTNYLATGLGPDYAISLDGTSGYVSLPSGTWFGGDFTMESWVFARSYNSWSRVFDFGNGGYVDDVYLALSSGGSGYPTMGAFAAGTTGPLVGSTNQLPLNQWVHLACTLSGATATIYVNGKPVGSGLMGIPPAVVRTNNYIGRSNFGGDAYANAIFDEARVWTVARTPAQIQYDMTHTLTGQEPGLEGYWRFDESSGSVAADQSTQGNKGTLLGSYAHNFVSSGPSFNAPETPFGYSLGFNDSSSYVDVPHNNSFDSLPLTVTAWVNTTQTNGNPGLVNMYGSSELNGWNLFLVNGHAMAWYFANLYQNVWHGTVGANGLDGGMVADGQWHQLAFTVDATGGTLYVDGNLKTNLPWTGPATSATSARDVALGWYPGSPSPSFYTGLLDDVSIWNIALSQAQIQSSLSNSFVGNEPGLAAYWRCDEGVGRILMDQTANGNTGSFVGSPFFTARTNGPDFHPTLGSRMSLPISENTPRSISLPAFDIDSVLNWNNAFDTNSVFPGTLSLNPTNGTLSFLPALNYVGPVTINYSATDGQFTNSATLNLQVQHVPQPPSVALLGLQFNGTNNLVMITNFGAELPTSEVTVEFWEKVKQPNLQSTFILNPDVASNRFNAYVPYPGGNYGTVYWDFGDINNGGRLSYALPSDISGKWTHFAMVSSQSGGYMALYINGILAAQTQRSSTYQPTAGDLFLGVPPFAGALSEFRIWNVARAATNILSDMVSSLAGNEPGLVAYYRLSEGSGVTLSDSGPSLGGSYNGTILGGSPYPVWVPGPTNFDQFQVVSFSSNNAVYLPAFDPDTSLANLTWTIISNNNLHGTLTQVNGGQWLYTPDPSFSGGRVSFTYSVSDGVLSNSSTVFINVAQFNPPVLSAIPNQLTPQDTPTGPIHFTLTDSSTPVNQLTLSVVSDNSTLVSTNYTISLLDTNGTLVLTPNPGQIGFATITISASDGRNTTSSSFVLQVIQNPVYTIVDLGVLPNRFASYATAINNQGQVVGYSTDGSINQNQKVPFFYTGFAGSGQLAGLNSISGGYASSINNQGKITGTYSTANGSQHAFFYDPFGAAAVVDFGALGTNAGTSFSSGLGINDNGTVVGDSSTTTAGQIHAFESGAGLQDFGFPGASVFNAINNGGQIIGYVAAGPVTNGFVITPPSTNSVGSTNYFAALPGGSSTVPLALNQFGDVVGTGDVGSGRTHGWLQQAGTGSELDLGTLPGFVSSRAYGINGFRQIVGSSTDSGGTSHAFLYATGKLYDLNDLLPYEETNTWTLNDARGINDQGQIVGTGKINGHDHAFLALPARPVGLPIPRPLGTVAKLPAIDIIDPQRPDDSASTAFFWSPPDQQLYAIRPVTATIHWQSASGSPVGPGSTNIGGAVTVDVTSKNVWPRNAETDIAGAPVQVVPQGLPQGASFPYSFQTMLFSTIVGAGVDPSTQVFAPQTPGYSVLRYLVITPGLPIDPINSYSHFEVVRTVAWNDRNYLADGVPATIGTAITNATHFDYAGRNGYVFFPKTVYDGVPSDPNHAYDLPTRKGPIIPVNLINKNLTPPDQDLVVVWYHTNAIGVAWADSPYRFVPEWPANPDTIVIASQLGSGQFDTTQINNPQPYVQNDPTLPGFNPNEEHSLIVGNTLFALRNDLNSYFGNLSQPYSLLKYQDNSGVWRMHVYQVVATNAQYQFVYPGTAGTQINPPLPLSAMQICHQNNQGVSGPFYKAAADDSLWARAAGPLGQSTNVVIHYWYPLQPSFYYGAAGSPGQCVPWLDQGLTNPPVDVTYVISWPTNSTYLEVGQTLTTSFNGLPDIADQISAKIVYDELNPTGQLTTTNLARLYDPISPRVLPVNPTASWLNTLKLQNVNGVEQFADLPYFLRIRLSYDPINGLISFSGLMASTSPGAAPVLLPNVMSERELHDIRQLDGDTGTSDFDKLITSLYQLTRNPNRLTLSPVGTNPTNFDKALLIGLALATNANGSLSIVPQSFGAGPKALTTGLFGVPPAQPTTPGGTNYPPRFVTVVVDDPTTPGAPVSMYVIRVDNGPYGGSLAVMPGDNAFDQRLTLRYADDFGGDPGPLQFEWYYFPGDNGGVAPANPQIGQDGTVTNLNNWLPFFTTDVPNTRLTNGMGAHYITLGVGGESGLLTMSDNWFVGRYKGYGIDGSTNWSDWVGQPGGNQAQFAEGWINRVLTALNPFEARSTDFHTSPINTYSTMLEQAGPRYEGPIALNADPNYLNSVGLIQAYQTVLERGESLSINGTPPVNFQPANQALLNAASRISDFYVLLGNEAYAEASDPTIGFQTGLATFGSLASSIFAFEDQVDTLLDQQLDLLRGRDDSATTVQAPPVYNRLYWNFTGGNGEVAYVQTFNLKDLNGDGLINATDARIMFPQGHGDAWGHYLTALTVYYDLLRNPNYTWVPRAEAVSLGGVAVQVNYEDERKFAHAAAAKAQTGCDILNLTYRSAYVEDPNGQYQGYKDTNPNRAWGLSEWARRAGQGAYFDWVTVNALLPAADTNQNDTGLSKVDRTTVTDIGLIPAAASTLQDQLDKADAGLNPLGLAKNAVPFDIDPNLVAAGETHFEQIYGRAVSAMANAVSVWNQANQFTSALRQQQDTVNNFTQNIVKQDQAYQDRLIEIFGYPFAGDIGTPGGAYPAGYSGPDIYHYMYADTSAFDATVSRPSSILTAYFTNMPSAGVYFPADLPQTYTRPSGSNILNVSFPLADGTHRFEPPTSWGVRRAPGEIQMALSDLLQSQGRLDQAVDNYGALIQQIEDGATLLLAQYNLAAENQSINDKTQNTVEGLQAGIAAAKLTAAGLTAAKSTLADVEDITLSGLPTVEGLADDALGGVRASIKTVGSVKSTLLQIGQAAASGAQTVMQDAIIKAQNQAAIGIAANNLAYQIQQQQLALLNLLRQEPGARADCATMRETVAQNMGRYQAALANGQQILEQRATFAKQAAAQTQSARYVDMTFRIFQNDAIQKYQAQFTLAQRYVYLAAIAYDFETQLLGDASGSGQQFLTDIIRQQSLGEMDNGQPVNGVAGLADPLARLSENFAVLKGQLGFNNPQTETGKFSLRYGLFRQQPNVTNVIPINGVFTNDWETELKNHIVPDLWQIPEFRRYCRPFAPESAGPQPGLVIRFGTTITFGLNFFGWPLSGGDSSYDPTLFATKVRSVGAWFAGYDNSGLSTTPRIYLIPVGADVMRSPTDGQTIRQWHVVDQALPVPFPLGVSTEAAANYIPMNDSLSGTLESIRQFSSFLGYTDQGNLVDPTQVTTSTRLIGRSVWNTEWMLIIPGGTLLADPNQGLQGFVNSVSDIKIFFQTYAYSGN